MEKNITISIQRDAKNIPFAKVYYNGQDAFSLDDYSLTSPIYCYYTLICLSLTIQIYLESQIYFFHIRLFNNSSIF